ncbi:tandem-95 repeat protein, partial [Flavihumibacter sp. R14]|nr:tandem-95 repeat protein [Flavihumibacter soli]
GTLESNIATVTLTVTPVNDAPVALNDAYTTTEETPITIAAPGILVNDSDIDGDAITAIKVTDPANGTLVFNADGSFTYTPNANFNGTDSFTYKVSDGSLESNTATVTITVTPVNDAPVALNDAYTTTEETPVSVPLPGVMTNDSDIDGDAITAIKVTDPANGTLVFNADGSFTYTPNANFNG